MNWPLAFFLAASIASVFGFMGWVAYLSMRYTNAPEDTEE